DNPMLADDWLSPDFLTAPCLIARPPAPIPPVRHCLQTGQCREIATRFADFVLSPIAELTSRKRPAIRQHAQTTVGDRPVPKIDRDYQVSLMATQSKTRRRNRSKCAEALCESSWDDKAIDFRCATHPL